jgi:hypothetical protein
MRQSVTNATNSKLKRANRDWFAQVLLCALCHRKVGARRVSKRGGGQRCLPFELCKVTFCCAGSRWEVWAGTA